MLWQEHVAGVAEPVPMEDLVQHRFHLTMTNCLHHPENKMDENMLSIESKAQSVEN